MKNELSPYISVIMPIRNEEQYIKRSLSAVLGQDYPADSIEVLVVDGMSTDGTRKIVESAKKQFLHLRMIDNPGKIVPTGLNTAIQQARGEIIVRVDGHCEIAPDYIRCCVSHLQHDQVDCVGGPIETIGETPTAKTIALAMSSVFGVGGSAFRTVKHRTMNVDTVAFPAYTKQIIHKIGLYDEELVRNQDDEYNYRLRKQGGKILFSPKVRSQYYSRSSLTALWRQYYQYGYWKVRVLQKHPRQMRPRQFVPPIFVATLIISALLTLFLSQSRAFLEAIVGFYVLTNLVASIREGQREGWQHILLLPLVYTILHVSYGLGFLVGLVKFINRWS